MAPGMRTPAVDVTTIPDVLDLLDLGARVTLGLAHVADADTNVDTELPVRRPEELSVADPDPDDVLEAKSIVLLEKDGQDESQSNGILLPSSSSNERGARVHAGADELLIELLLVALVVVLDVEVLAVVDAQVEIVVAEIADDMSTDSLQNTISSVAVL
ncbi:hypothetical protein ACEQ8H_008554 [Pleosporales sp. CAS-2024a]